MSVTYVQAESASCVCRVCRVRRVCRLIDGGCVGNLGNVSLGVLYVTVAVTVFLAPAIVYACREKWTMVFGALCYVVRAPMTPLPPRLDVMVSE